MCFWMGSYVSANLKLASLVDGTSCWAPLCAVHTCAVAICVRSITSGNLVFQFQGNTALHAVTSHPPRNAHSPTSHHLTFNPLNATLVIACLQDVFESFGWRRVGKDATDWDVYWCNAAFVHDMPSTLALGTDVRQDMAATLATASARTHSSSYLPWPLPASRFTVGARVGVTNAWHRREARHGQHWPLLQLAHTLQLPWSLLASRHVCCLVGPITVGATHRWHSVGLIVGAAVGARVCH
jgi:hypothetical protein